MTYFQKSKSFNKEELVNFLTDTFYNICENLGIDSVVREIVNSKYWMITDAIDKYLDMGDDIKTNADNLIKDLDRVKGDSIKVAKILSSIPTFDDEDDLFTWLNSPSPNGFMTPKEFEDYMKNEANEEGPEEFHIDADKTMIRLLRSLGYDKGCDIFDNTEKWYS